MKLVNIAIPATIVIIVLVIILPIPPTILDFLLVINISLSLVIVLNTIYAKDSIQLSAFPTILLFTTVYRLSLNIKSTQLILTKG